MTSPSTIPDDAWYGENHAAIDAVINLSASASSLETSGGGFTDMAPSTPDSQSDPLRPEHRRELEIGSGVDPRVIARRGYRSVTAAEVEAMGFAPSQCRPGWFAPTWTLAGVPLGGFLKPNEPRNLEQPNPEI